MILGFYYQYYLLSIREIIIDPFLVLYLFKIPMLTKFTIILSLAALTLSIDKVINYNQEPYAALHAFFGPGGV